MSDTRSELTGGARTVGVADAGCTYVNPELLSNVAGTTLGGWPTLIQSEVFWGPSNEYPASPEHVFQIDSTEKGMTGSLVSAGSSLQHRSRLQWGVRLALPGGLSCPA